VIYTFIKISAGRGKERHNTTEPINNGIAGEEPKSETSAHLCGIKLASHEIFHADQTYSGLRVTNPDREAIISLF
jgi:hypothetical protein